MTTSLTGEDYDKVQTRLFSMLFLSHAIPVHFWRVVIIWGLEIGCLSVIKCDFHTIIFAPQ